MGAALCCNIYNPLGAPEPVRLQIYDVFGNTAVRKMNRLFRAMGTGAFHAGVEVYGKEWSFGFIEQGSGVFYCTPRGCEGHRYREEVTMGFTDMTSSQVEDLLNDLRLEWPGTDYDLLHRNCCHFSSELCQRLGVGSAPKWVTNLAGAGATLNKGVKTAASLPGQAFSKAQSTAIVAKAKAGDIEDKYRIKGRVTASAKDLVAKAGKVGGVASTAASKAGSMAGKAARKSVSAAVAVKDVGQKVVKTLSGRSKSDPERLDSDPEEGEVAA